MATHILRQSTDAGMGLRPYDLVLAMAETINKRRNRVRLSGLPFDATLDDVKQAMSELGELRAQMERSASVGVQTSLSALRAC
jgi:hypothetical protein